MCNNIYRRESLCCAYMFNKYDLPFSSASFKLGSTLNSFLSKKATNILCNPFKQFS